MKTFVAELGSVSTITSDEALEGLLPLRIVVSEKYLAGGSTEGTRYALTVGDYLNHPEWARKGRLVCPEDYSAGAGLIDCLRKEEAFTALDLSRGRASVHAAYGGSVTPLHFDWDFSVVHHLCLAGRRRVWLCPPQRAQWLPVRGNSVLADFEAMDASQRERTLAWIGAEPIELEAGMFVRFPSFWWHLVDYLETSAAVSVRTESDPVLRPLAALPRSADLQWLASVLAGCGRDRAIDVLSLLIRRIADEWRRGGRFSGHSRVVRQCSEEMDIPPSLSDPWVLPDPPSDGPKEDLRYRRAMNMIEGEAPEIDLCRTWLFASWPASGAVSHEDASLLAGALASIMSPTPSSQKQEAPA